MSQNDRAELEKKIVKYRALARWVPDPETARRINELVSELEQQLHASRGQVGLSAPRQSPGTSRNSFARSSVRFLDQAVRSLCSSASGSTGASRAARHIRQTQKNRPKAVFL